LEDLAKIEREYMRRVMFIYYSELFVHIVDVMEYDVDKMRDNMVKVVDKKYQKALRHYGR